MRKRHLGVVLIVFMMIAAACSDDEAAEPSGEPIVIGIIADLTGPFTTYGNSLSRSAQLAVAEINAAGGIDGRPVEVIIEDIQSDPTVTVDKARKLVESDNVDLVMGPIGSDANDAAYQTVVQEGGKLLFYTETYEGGKCDDLYFSFGAVPAQQIRPMIPILQAEYGPNVMLFGADYVWPRRSFEIAKPIIEEGGGTVVSELYLPLIAEDFSELVQEVRDKQPDYLFSLYPALWGPALKALDDAGLLADLGVGNIFLGDGDYLGIADLAEGQYTALPYFTVAEGGAAEDFLAAYQAMFGANEFPSGGEGVGAYDAVYMYKDAVEEAGSTDPAAVAEALVGNSFDGPTGKVTMTPSHHLQQTINLVQAQNGEYVLIDSFKDADPEEACTL